MRTIKGPCFDCDIRACWCGWGDTDECACHSPMGERTEPTAKIELQDEAMRRDLDKYRTPPWMTEAFKESFPDVRGDVLIDPCAGDGRMSGALEGRFRSVITNDIDLAENTAEHFDATLSAYWEDPNCVSRWYDTDRANMWVVSNPPFVHATAIIKHALRLTPNVAMLLRSTWLEPTKERAELLKTCPPSRMLYLPRGSFTGGGSDSVSCAWFVWGGDVGSTPPIRVWSGIPGQKELVLDNRREPC